MQITLNSSLDEVFNAMDLEGHPFAAKWNKETDLTPEQAIAKLEKQAEEIHLLLESCEEAEAAIEFVRKQYAKLAGKHRTKALRHEELDAQGGVSLPWSDPARANWMRVFPDARAFIILHDHVWMTKDYMSYFKVT
jgi:hypothetical protein